MFKKLVNNIRCCLLIKAKDKYINKLKGDKYDKEFNREYALNTY